MSILVSLQVIPTARSAVSKKLGWLIFIIVLAGIMAGGTLLAGMMLMLGGDQTVSFSLAVHHA
jgi:hypothetical protein